MKALNIFDPKISYSSIDDKNVLSFIEIIRSGIQFKIFLVFANSSPFTLFGFGAICLWVGARFDRKAFFRGGVVISLIGVLLIEQIRDIKAQL